MEGYTVHHHNILILWIINFEEHAPNYTYGKLQYLLWHFSAVIYKAHALPGLLLQCVQHCRDL